MHAVAVPGPGPRLTIEAGLGLQLSAECLGALEVLVLRLGVQLPGLVSLVRGAGLVTSLTGGPGALGEAPAEPVLGMSPLIVVREISGHIDKTYISSGKLLQPKLCHISSKPVFCSLVLGRCFSLACLQLS